MSEIGNTVTSGITLQRKSLLAYFLTISAILASLFSAPTTHALSLPVVDHLLNKLLPRSDPDYDNPPQAATTPTQPPPAKQTEQPAQPPQAALNITQPSETAPVITPIDAPELTPATPVASLSSAARNTEHDVLNERMENAAIAYNQEQLSPLQTCGQLFGTCWYIAAPAGIIAITSAYLLITRSKHLALRLK